ncbi:MAG: hypothetical protein R3F02_18480 [Thiolinea sp.]
MIVGYEELKKHFGGGTIAEVVINLKRNKVKYLIGKGNKPVTTEAAINAAMGITPGQPVNETPPPPIFKVM